jgi:hypothetical protein
MDPDLEGPKT